MIPSLQYGGGLFFTFTNAEETPGGEAVFDILKNRNPRSFSRDTQSILELITIQEGEINPVGSQRYTVARYPGDIDLMEPIEYCCSLKSVTNKIAAGITKIAKGIKNTPQCYLGDFKAGVDFRYEDLKESLGDIDETGEVKGYMYSSLKKTVIKLRTKKLLTNADFKEINDLARKKISVSNWTILYKFCKKFWVIRWSLEELISGEKMVGIKIAKKFNLTLSVALSHKTVCKLDLWAPVNGRFIEITNFFITSYMDKKGNSFPISPPLGRYKERLITDIKHYGDKNLESYNPLKMAKRMWAIAVSIGDQKTLRKIYPLFHHGASILYQINAEIETVLEMLSDSKIEEEIINDGSLEIIIKQIEGFKHRISVIFDMEIYEDLIFSIVDDIVMSDTNYHFIIQKLNHLSAILVESFSDASKVYLKNVDLLNANYYDYLLK